MPWNIDDFNLNDEINQEIWEDSPDLQRHVHSQTKDDGTRRFNGDFGCQQAMLGGNGFDPNPLPWVPDLVGKDFGKKRSLLIVGSAYAAFIQGYGGRNAICRNQYRNARSAGAFLNNHFIPSVANEDGGSYYDRIASLLWPERNQRKVVSPRSLAVTDLCRGSFVYRYPKYEQRDDLFGDKVVNGSHKRILNNAHRQLCRQIYDSYCRMENQYGWLNRRMNAPKLAAILALGSIAECGLLRRLHQLGAQIRENCSGSEFIPTNHRPPTNWVRNYASNQFRQLDYWLESKRWWNVSFRNGTQFRVLPAYHPAKPWSGDYPNQLRQKLRETFDHGE